MTTTEVAPTYPEAHAGSIEAARPSHALRLRSVLPVDLAALSLAIVLAEVGAARAGVPPTQLPVLIAFPALTLLLFAVRGTYRRRVRTSIFEDLRAVATTTALAAMVTLCVQALLTPDPGIAQQSARLWAFAAGFVAAARLTLHWHEQSARKAGESLSPTLIVGAGRVGRLVAERLLAMPQLGLKPIGFLDKDPLQPVSENGVLVPVLGASWDLEEVVRRHDVEHVIITFSTAPNDVLLRLFRRCEDLGLAISMVPRLYELTTKRLSVEHLGGLPLVSAHPADPRGLQFALKYAIDRVLGGALIVLLSPLLATAAIATYLSLGRPIFFRQRRVGRDGVEFDILKFRTMHLPRPSAPAFALEHGLAPGGVEGDDRRTMVGRILRKASLDELPQLFNVLSGKMSLVGPRPERPEFVSEFDRSVYRYGDRHRVKAGITGWAQVNGLRGKTSIADRAEWDNYYIENFSLWLDTKIVVMTFAALFTGFKTVE
jgi:exopolysaccharide biosynthesis polyprenyl glycosylphosphotransferase